MATLTCAECGCAFEGNPRRRYCSQTCSGRAYRTRNPRTTTERGLGWDYQQARKRVLERDGHVCTYCGAEATTADHVIPRAMGGSSTDDNLVAACEPCNRLKGDSLTPPTSPLPRPAPASTRTTARPRWPDPTDPNTPPDVFDGRPHSWTDRYGVHHVVNETP